MKIKLAVNHFLTYSAIIVSVLVLACFISISAYSLAVRTYSIKQLDLPYGFTITAHTGNNGTSDNSLESIRTAHSLGADAVEFDLCFNSSGVPVLAHDAESSDNEGLVTLAQAFELVASYDDMKLNIDVKEDDDLALVEKMIFDYGLLGRAYFTGIDTKTQPIWQRNASTVPYLLNLKVSNSEKHDRTALLKIAERTKALGARGLNINYKQASKLLVEVMHEQGLEVSVWTVNNRYDMRRVLAMGVDNVTTRIPDCVRNTLRYW